MQRFLLLTGLVFVSTAMAEDRGWTIGGGLVSSDIINAEQEAGFFPSFEVDNKRFMFIPNLSYQWDAWSFGADGIGWKTQTESGLQAQIKAGYPRSSASIGGQQGWFRYGTSSALSYSNGVTGTQSLTLGPVSYAATLGFAQRRDDFSQKFSIGFPLLLLPEQGLTVIGTGYLEQQNASFINNTYELTSERDQADYWHQGLNAFAVYQINSRATLLVSGTLQWNDDALATEIGPLPKTQFNIFTMFSYFLGKQDSKQGNEVQ